MGKIINRLICAILLLYIMITCANMCLYEEGVYDCSNMVADQYVVFDGLGLEPNVIIDHDIHHTYLYLSKINVYWECTRMCPIVHISDNGKTFENITDAYANGNVVEGDYDKRFMNGF